MNDLEQVLWDAWDRIAPKLQSNPVELRARLARRRGRMFNRPPRAFCLAVRASDRRINLATAALAPEHALDTSCVGHPGRVVEHDVLLDKRLLLKLCQPVETERPGIPAYILAEKLGCGPEGLRALRRNRSVSVTYVPGFLGRHGPPIPFIYSPHPLDPCMAGKGRPDPIWGLLWRMNAQCLPDDFEQPVLRIPIYLHSRPSAKVPLSLDSFLPTANRQPPTDFRGFTWLCPSCNKPAKTLYCPTPIPDWSQYIGLQLDLPELSRPRSAPCFACGQCHGIINFSRATLRESWNHLILHFSGGLLFGHEVARPAWLQPQRKRTFTTRSHPAPRREALTRLLATDLSIEEIARLLSIKPQSVKTLSYPIFHRHHVRSRQSLRAKLNTQSLAAG